MSSSTPWRGWGDRFVARYAYSSWRLPALLLGSSLALFGPLYLLRGIRLVQFAGIGIVGVVAAATCFALPLPTLLVAIFIATSGIDLLLPGPLGLGLLAIVLARVGFDALSGKRIDWGTTPFRWSLVILLAICLTSLLVARDFGFSLGEIRNLAIGLSFYLAVSVYVDRPDRLARVFLALCLGLGVCSLVPLREVLASGSLFSMALLLATRVGGLGMDPNLHAADLDATLPLLVAGLGYVHGWRRWTFALLLPLYIGSVILTQSRAGLALLGLLLVVTLLRAGRVGRGLAIGGFVGLGLTLLLLPHGYWVRFVSLGQLQGIIVDRSLLIREHMLYNAIDIFRRHPLLGVGLGNLRMESPEYMLGGYMAHNSYLEVAGGLGIFGLIAYLALLWTGLRMAGFAAAWWRTLGRHAEQVLAESVVIGLLAFCAIVLTLSIPFSLELWLLLAFANAARRCALATEAPTPMLVMRAGDTPPDSPWGTATRTRR